MSGKHFRWKSSHLKWMRANTDLTDGQMAARIGTTAQRVKCARRRHHIYKRYGPLERGEDGRTLRYDSITSVRLPSDVFEKVKTLACGQGKSMAQFIRESMADLVSVQQETTKP